MRRVMHGLCTTGSIYLLLFSCLSCSDPASPDYGNLHDPSSVLFMPTSPSCLTITGPTETVRHVTWQDNSHYEGEYLIERKLGLNGVYETLGLIASNTTSFDDFSVIRTDTAYFYRVAAVSARGRAGFADSLTFVLPFPKPSSLTIHTNSSLSATLGWTDNSGFEEEFIVERREANSAYQERGRSGPNVTVFTDTQMDSTRDYYYRVRAVTQHNSSRYADEVRAAYFPSGTNRGTIADLYGSFNAYQASNDGNYLLLAGWPVGGSDYGTFMVYNVNTRQLQQQRHGTVLRWITMSPDDKFVATVAEDSYLRVWNASDLSQCQAIATTSLYITQVAFSADGSSLICAFSDRAIRCWRISDGKILYWIHGRPQAITALAVSPDGKSFACAYGGQIELFDATSGASLYLLPTLPDPVSLLKYSANNLLASMSGDNRIDVWDGATGGAVQTITGFSTTRSVLTFTDDGKFIVAYANSALAIWRLSDKRLVRSWSYEYNLPYRGLPDILFTVSQKNIIATFAAQQGNELDIYPFSYQWDLLTN